MKGEISHELEVEVPANDVWEIYGGLKLGMMFKELIPDIMQKVEVIQGDGGVGTILLVVFQPGGLVAYHKERFVAIDKEKRIKVVEVIEGGFLNFGFSLYRICFEIIKKDTDSSIIKSTTEYEVDDEYATNASLVNNKTLIAIAEAVNIHFTNKHVNVKL